MKTKKQDLINNPIKYSNNDYILECFYSDMRFCLKFNSSLSSSIMTYKTWNGFVRLRNFLVDKYNLIQTQ